MTVAPPIMFDAVILKLFWPVNCVTMSLTLPHTPAAASSRYSTVAATTPTTQRAKPSTIVNFSTDHGSMRRSRSRARRGPRPPTVTRGCPRSPIIRALAAVAFGDCGPEPCDPGPCGPEPGGTEPGGTDPGAPRTCGVSPRGITACTPGAPPQIR